MYEIFLSHTVHANNHHSFHQRHTMFKQTETPTARHVSLGEEAILSLCSFSCVIRLKSRIAL